jgi:hypothetical protein
MCPRCNLAPYPFNSIAQYCQFYVRAATACPPEKPTQTHSPRLGCLWLQVYRSFTTEFFKDCLTNTPPRHLDLIYEQEIRINELRDSHGVLRQPWMDQASAVQDPFPSFPPPPSPLYERLSAHISKPFRVNPCVPPLSLPFLCTGGP